MKNVNKICLVLLFVLTVWSIAGKQNTSAASHPESSIHSFSVETDAYNVNWESRRTLNVYCEGKVKGTITIYVGVARSKFFLSSGKQLSTVMIRAIITPKNYTYTRKVLWWTETVTEYGIIDELSYNMDFQTINAELLDVSPKNTPTSSIYNVGINAGVSGTTANGGSIGANLGISASQSFIANALKIINKSDTSVNNAGTLYQYLFSSWRWNWERNSYNFYESEHKAAYSVGLITRQYCYLDVKAVFNSADSEPGWWQNYLGKYNSSLYMAIIYV